jgi:thymidine kinase
MSLHNKLNNGYLNLIIGPMFSGKSTRLIQYIRQYKTLSFSMIVVKPSIDTRYTESNEICTHNFEKESCISYGTTELENIFKEKNYIESKIIIIEEGQFFSNLYEIVKKMTDIDKKVVYITALNGDSNRELFGDVYKLLPLCDNVEFMQSLCIKCSDGTLGIYSKRYSSNHDQVCVGGASVYQAVCREHYFADDI